MRAGLPEDAAQWIAAAMSVAALLLAPRLVKPARRPALFIGVAAGAALLLSALYIVVYLRGGPRIIDATSYWLSGRALSEGFLRFPMDEPVASTLGRFLVRSDAPDGPGASVIFPPGYPALLALGFRIGAPLAVGPLLAAALVITTYDLALRVAQSLSSAPEASLAADDRPFPPAAVAQIAAALSVVCGALRYHTADTMSHGLSALCFSASLTLAFRSLDSLKASPRRALGLALGAGLFAGWLVATRPVTGLALGCALAAILVRERDQPWLARARIAAAFALAAVPGLALLAAHQRAATGAIGASSQTLYYAVSDGPPGCFRYGFGAGIGCVGEHGDFVERYLSPSYGAIEAALTTFRRLKMHLVDAANAEPLALLVPLGAIVGRRSRRVLWLAAASALVVAAYIPFYFDGNYPGGGARFFADVLPLEHVLMAVAAVEIARRAGASRRIVAHTTNTTVLPRIAGSVVALSLLGFALRGGFDHAALRDREGGRPMFEPARLAEAGVTSGLVFIDTDHGFNLAFDPAMARGGASSLRIARFHGDALDRMAWEAAGRPAAYRYHFRFGDSAGPALVSIEPLRFDPSSPPLWRIEGESLWPALAQDGAFALPAFASGTCASSARILAVRAQPSSQPRSAPPSVTLSLPSPWLRGSTIAPTIATTPGAAGELTLLIDDAPARSWPISRPLQNEHEIDSERAARGFGCETLTPAQIPSDARKIELKITRIALDSRAEGAILALDRVDEIGDAGRGALKND